MTSDNDGDSVVVSSGCSGRPSPVPGAKRGRVPATTAAKGILVHNNKKSANTNRVSFVTHSSTSPSPAPLPPAERPKKKHNQPRRSDEEVADARLAYHAKTGRRLTGFGVKSYLHEFYDDPDGLESFQMKLWEVVHFTSENSVEAVPHTWLKKTKCAWPKNPRLVKRFIENHVEPNPTEFYYCPAIKLGKRSYDSLTLAQMKAAKATVTNDLSSTDDAQYNMSKKNYSTKQQSGIITKESHTSPPKYNEYLESKREELSSKNNIEQNKAQKPSNSFPPKKYTITTKSKNMNNLQEQDDDSSHDDLRNNNWKSKSVFNNVSSSDDDIVVGTPSKDNKFVKKLHSTKDNWKTHTVHTPERYHNTTAVTHSPATDKWTVSKTRETTYNEGPPVKRALFKDVKDPYNKPGLSADTSEILTSSEQNKNVQYKTTDAFQTFVVNTLINLKYEINNISNVVQANHLNIDCLLANANKNPSIDISNIECNMFPIEKDEDFYNFEKKIKIDNGFRESLIMKLSVLTDSNDLGNSVRRVIGRMFKDNVLVNYSLFGFKKKQCFSSLLSYRLIIDAIRTNIRYKNIPEKDIDNCLGIWLSHAPFRLKKKNSKQPDNL